jgi:hypothetical protein
LCKIIFRKNIEKVLIMATVVAIPRPAVLSLWRNRATRIRKSRGAAPVEEKRIKGQRMIRRTGKMATKISTKVKLRRMYGEREGE